MSSLLAIVVEFFMEYNKINNRTVIYIDMYMYI